MWSSKTSRNNSSLKWNATLSRAYLLSFNELLRAIVRLHHRCRRHRRLFIEAFVIRFRVSAQTHAGGNPKLSFNNGIVVIARTGIERFRWFLWLKIVILIPKSDQ